MKKVLITNLYFAKYTGSELHALEIAKLFVQHGYDVTLAVFQKGFPLLEKADFFRVVDCLHEDLNETEFDVVFVQHYPVFDYLCSRYDITYNKMVVSKLSVISELEYLPICTNDADLILCVSDECAGQVQKDIGKDSRIHVFPNSVEDDFFVLGEQRKEKRDLCKIAVVSNHVPTELLDLPAIIGDAYSIDYIGADYTPKLVTAELLNEYDLIITIGRTVQQCFALKVPVYVYDYFGGPGYITEHIFDVAAENNFSGRGGFTRKSPEELKDDIVSNYNANLTNLDWLYNLAKSKYSYRANFEWVLSYLDAKDTEIKQINYFRGVDKQRMELYTKALPLYAIKPDIISQLYIDYGQGFHENESIIWNASENYIITKKIRIEKNVKALRFDPCNIPANCYVQSIIINGNRKDEYDNKNKEFLDFDPQFMITLSEEEQVDSGLLIEITYKFQSVSWENMTEKYKQMICNLKKENNEMSAALNRVKRNYYCVPKIQAVIRKLFGGRK